MKQQFPIDATASRLQTFVSKRMKMKEADENS